MTFHEFLAENLNFCRRLALHRQQLLLISRSKIRITDIVVILYFPPISVDEERNSLLMFNDIYCQEHFICCLVVEGEYFDSKLRICWKSCLNDFISVVEDVYYFLANMVIYIALFSSLLSEKSYSLNISWHTEQKINNFVDSTHFWSSYEVEKSV